MFSFSVSSRFISKSSCITCTSLAYRQAQVSCRILVLHILNYPGVRQVLWCKFTCTDCQKKNYKIFCCFQDFCLCGTHTPHILKMTGMLSLLNVFRNKRDKPVSIPRHTVYQVASDVCFGESPLMCCIKTNWNGFLHVVLSNGLIRWPGYCIFCTIARNLRHLILFNCFCRRTFCRTYS